MDFSKTFHTMSVQPSATNPSVSVDAYQRNVQFLVAISLLTITSGKKEQQHSSPKACLYVPTSDLPKDPTKVATKFLTCFFFPNCRFGRTPGVAANSCNTNQTVASMLSGGGGMHGVYAVRC